MNSNENKLLNSVYSDDPVYYSKIRNCWLNTRREHFLCQYIKRMDDVNVILEIGSGTGDLLCNLAEHFPMHKFTGVEPIRSYISFAEKLAVQRGLKNISFINIPAEEMSKACKENSHDLVLSNDVLHHVNDMDKVIDSINYTTHPKSRWIAIEPNCLNPYVFAGQMTKVGEKNFNHFQYRNKIVQKLWSVTEKRYLFLIPPFIKNPPGFLINIEMAIEGFPFIAGGVAICSERS